MLTIENDPFKKKILSEPIKNISVDDSNNIKSLNGMNELKLDANEIDSLILSDKEEIISENS